jgi:hypothetical protein
VLGLAVALAQNARAFDTVSGDRRGVVEPTEQQFRQSLACGDEGELTGRAALAQPIGCCGRQGPETTNIAADQRRPHCYERQRLLGIGVCPNCHRLDQVQAGEVVSKDAGRAQDAGGPLCGDQVSFVDERSDMCPIAIACGTSFAAIAASIARISNGVADCLGIEDPSRSAAASRRTVIA